MHLVRTTVGWFGYVPSYSVNRLCEGLDCDGSWAGMTRLGTGGDSTCIWDEAEDVVARLAVGRQGK